MATYQTRNDARKAAAGTKSISSAYTPKTATAGKNQAVGTSTINQAKKKKNTSSTATTTQPIGYVDTNTSYNGNYVGVDLGTDYSAKMNEAVASGDYYKAAQYEAARNAKINYLDSIGRNTGNYTTTNNYVDNYMSGGQNVINNRGGATYTSKFSDFNNLPSNWTTANVNEAMYRNDNGLISQNTNLSSSRTDDNWAIRGNAINPTTGEWTFNNQADAETAAYDDYLRAVGGSQYGSVQEGRNAVRNSGVLGSDYINRVQNGTAGQYANEQANKMLEQENREKTLQAFFANQNNNKKSYKADDDGWSSNEINDIANAFNEYMDNSSANEEQRRVIHTNSFESDSTLAPDYHAYIRSQNYRGLFNLR